MYFRSWVILIQLQIQGSVDNHVYKTRKWDKTSDTITPGTERRHTRLSNLKFVEHSLPGLLELRLKSSWKQIGGGGLVAVMY
ncbi:hypothetical protein ScPMuIL_005872 [Solemya velum]